MSHEAMATTFSLRVAHADQRYARQAMAAAFAELDALERQLSRFVEGSDVWRINRLARGGEAVVTPDAFACLRAAIDVWRGTRGVFDVTYASTCAAAPGDRMELASAGCRVRILADGARVDLGGIGKGFALDRMAAVLAQWETTAALLAASTSTILALEAPPGLPGWRVTFGPDRDPQRLDLSHAAFSGSGTAVKGSHIIDPRTRAPARRHVQAWAQCPTAAQADALSTAFMVMSADEVRRYCHGDLAARGYLLDADDGILQAFCPPSFCRLEKITHATA